MNETEVVFLFGFLLQNNAKALFMNELTFLNENISKP